MLRFFPVAVAVLLSVSAADFGSGNIEVPVENMKGPRNHLTQTKLSRNEVTARTEFIADGRRAEAKDMTIDRTEEKLSEEITENNLQEFSVRQKILRITWGMIPSAVKYKIFYNGENYFSYTNGIEIPVDDFNHKIKITALDYDGNILEENVDVIETEESPTTPRTTTEFDKMAYPQIYPVYSWIPVRDADHYEIELIKDGEIVRRFVTNYHPEEDNFDFYDTNAIIETGEYYWRVRGISANGEALTGWSAKNAGNSFKVMTPTEYCAIGDSITHGGGSISAPPSTVLYNWETYCDFPIKNLGKSGDTSAQIVNRFDYDVLPFHPQILFVMAGVNDYRNNIFGWSSVMNLREIKDRCALHGIRVVFITPTPINPHLIHKCNFVETPPSDWKEHQRFICDWIRDQENFIDITEELTDSEGNLRADLTTDGLHPDAEGKKIIGRAVSDWLEKNLNAPQPSEEI